MCCARRGGPRTPSRTIDANHDSAFVDNAIVFVVPNIGGSHPLTTPLKLSMVSTLFVIAGEVSDVFEGDLPEKPLPNS